MQLQEKTVCVQTATVSRDSTVMEVYVLFVVAAHLSSFSLVSESCSCGCDLKSTSCTLPLFSSGSLVNGISRCRSLLSASLSWTWPLQSRPPQRRPASSHHDDPTSKRSADPVCVFYIFIAVCTHTLGLWTGCCCEHTGVHSVCSHVAVCLHM